MFKTLRNLDKRIKLQILCFFLLILVLNVLTIPYADDFPYSISNGIFDIFRLEYIQYMTWGGRSVAHILARIFLALPKIVFNVTNSLMFVFLIILIYLHSKGKNSKDSPLTFAFIAILIFVFSPMFGQTVLWETGACNYLWTTCIILTFLYIYRMNGMNWNNRLLVLPIFILGILAGWSNENMGGACILFTLIFLAFKHFEDKRITIWMIAGFIGACLGFIIMILAPGNVIRALDFPQTGSLIYTLTHDLTNTIDVLREGFYLPTILLIIFATINWSMNRKFKCISFSLIYYFCGLAAVGAIILSPVPVLWDRSMFGALIFVVIALTIQFYEVIIFQDKFKILCNILVFILIFESSLAYASASFDLFYTWIQNKQRENYVQYQVENGNMNPVVFQIFKEFVTKYNPIYGLGDITPYQSFWLNKGYSEVHNLESVQSTPLRIWEKIYKNGDPTLMNIQEMNSYIDYIKDNPNFIIFINTSDLNDKYQPYIALLNQLGINPEGMQNFVAVLDNGSIVVDEYGPNGIEYFGKFDAKEYYLGSYSKGDLSDIIIDGVEYTNNNLGINFVIFDKNQYRVVDSITFNTGNGFNGIRYQEGE